jgi:hypothetical protein
VIDYVLEEWNLSEIGIRIVRIGRGDDGRNALYLLGAVGAPISVYDGRAIRDMLGSVLSFHCEGTCEEILLAYGLA